MIGGVIVQLKSKQASGGTTQATDYTPTHDCGYVLVKSGQIVNPIIVMVNPLFVYIVKYGKISNTF